MKTLRSFAEDHHVLRKITGFFLALFTVLGTSLLVAPASHAASTINIDNVTFVNSVVEDGDRTSMKVSWSISDTATNPVAVTVQMPEGLVGYSDRFDMVGPGGVTAGECVVSATAITCTVDEAFINSNPKNVKGEFWFDVRTDLKNDETTDHIFDFGGNEVPVTVEPDTSRCDGPCEFTGYKLRKYGSYNSADDTITWTVRVPAPETGITAGKNITISDNLDTEIFEMLDTYEGESYPQLWEGRCLRDNDGEYYAPRWVERSTATWNADKTSVAFTSRAGSDPANWGSSSCVKQTEGSFYQAIWVVKVKDLGAAGTYSNEGSYTIDDTESGTTSGEVTKQSGGGNVIGENEGAFEVTKSLTGDAKFDASAEVTFLVNYTAYDTDDSVIGEGQLKVTPGSPVTSPTFPEGTRVVLSEVAPADPANVDWAAPVFKNSSGETVTEVVFSAANGNLGTNVAELSLVNESSLKTNTFTVKKTVSNPDNVEIPTSEYALDWTRPANPDAGIPEGANGTWTLPADGSEVTSGDMFAGVDYTLAEQTPAEVDGATWAAPKILVDGKEISANELVTLGLSDTPVAVEVVNEITKDPAAAGGFTLTKSVSGDGAEFVDADYIYTVNYSYPAGDGFEAGEGKLALKAGETVTVDNLPVGAVVTLSEEQPTDVGGATWSEPVFSTNNFTVVADVPAEVQLDNQLTMDPVPATGNFSVVKVVDGDGADLIAADAPFEVDYTYTLEGQTEAKTGSMIVRVDGTAVASEQLPQGTVVFLKEIAPVAVEGATWGEAKFSEDTVTIGDGTTVEITLTNTITKDEAAPTTGNFSVVKTVEGDGADLINTDAEFTVNYTYPAGDGFDAGEGTLTVKADGTAVTSDQLPTGAVLTLTETAPTAVEGATWGEAKFSENTVTIGDGTTVEITLTNTITRDEVVPSPTPTPTPTVEPTKPTVDPTEPTVDPTEPTVDPTDPTVDPTEPTVDPTDPTVDPTEPTVDPTDPTVDPTEPTVDPTDPTVDPTEPTVDPTDPTVDPTEPTVDPTDPTVDPTEPTVDPTVDPTEPTVDPTDPTVDPTEPTVDPTDPTVDPTEPTVDPTDPTVDPTEPTVDPTDPTVDPTEPTVDPTVDPTEPTVDPTEPTADPSEPTADSSDDSKSKAPDNNKSEKPNDDLADTGVSTGVLIAVPAALLLIAAGAIAFTTSRRRHS